MQKVRIREIEVYHGKEVVDNEYYIQHFAKQGKDIRKFLEETMGRKYRYVIDGEKENALTMAIESSKLVLEKANLTGKDIDMIVYSGILSEYASPTSALSIHSAISGKRECFCHDMNVNCIGMTYALDLASRYIATNNRINRVLVVGSDYLRPQVSPDNEQAHGQYGDASCALILERTEEDCGIIDTRIGTNTEFIDCVKFPKCGFSHIYDAPKEEVYAQWKSFGRWWIDGAITDINEMLDNNRLTKQDVSMFCFSQIAYKNVQILREKMSLDEKHSLYIGDVYGYTGTTSPFIVFYEGLKKGYIKRGDYAVFCTVAAGSTYISLLLKY